jgi:hypothetical protein
VLALERSTLVCGTCAQVSYDEPMPEVRHDQRARVPQAVAIEQLTPTLGVRLGSDTLMHVARCVCVCSTPAIGEKS